MTEHSLCAGCTRRAMLLTAGAVAAVAVTGCADSNADPEPLRIPVAEIPVGGGRVYPQQKVVVTRPAPGEIHVFSATCPHQGCLVSKVDAVAIECACHGSRFSPTDGSVLRGPAREPLSVRTAAVEAGEIVVR
ncbi:MULTISPECIES: QcrA and Rieske domain-containing protein [Nocardia]|uniref:QcrA and Rieske domain-containing protein n=1 Tax=Nocardia TaxID=1817 RepID=UPI0002F6CA46|nr:MULTISPECIES: Rieske (2Fe-2S) protein [Nocardia]